MRNDQAPRFRTFGHLLIASIVDPIVGNQTTSGDLWPISWGQAEGMSNTQFRTYRDKAAECIDAASKAVDPSERIELLKIAQGYLRLADRILTTATDRPTEPRPKH
jgi:hypothetical protein